MRSFTFLILTIIFCVFSYLGITQYLDPGVKLSLNIFNVLIMSVLLAVTVMFLYLFIESLFRTRGSIYHTIRAVLLGILISSIFFLRTAGLLSLVILAIIGGLYVLCELTIFEFQKK